MGVTGGNPYGFDLGTKAGTPGGPFIEGMNEGVMGMQIGGQRKIIGAYSGVRARLRVPEAFARCRSAAGAGLRQAAGAGDSAGACAAAARRALPGLTSDGDGIRTRRCTSTSSC